VITIKKRPGRSVAIDRAARLMLESFMTVLGISVTEHLINRSTTAAA
jgi:hypothetical protein